MKKPIFWRNEALGKRLKAAREAEGLTQYELAALANVPRFALWEQEAGTFRKFEQRNIERIATALKLTVQELRGEPVKAPTPKSEPTPKIEFVLSGQPLGVTSSGSPVAKSPAVPNRKSCLDTALRIISAEQLRALWLADLDLTWR